MNNNIMSRQLYSAIPQPITSQPTPEMKAKAEVYHGDEICKEKFTFLLTQIGLPDGLLSLDDIEEGGYVKEIGFVWLKHKKKKKKEHKFDNILVWYDTIVTAYLEPNRIKHLTGVKAKEFLVWISLSEIYVNDISSTKLITFKTPVGLSKSFPVTAFE
ncbi:hypothetical protein PanWU01x14_120810 [Parasponia andersonii]|uniref:DUF538 domain-containing protein n=1 Tax=Parasponia andersonii TaxID=3476 RepID=A0A2P5CV09_PARAD|nr:hypothetical protein PanWU01x14_120810 [Parasponia andersonii]